MRKTLKYFFLLTLFVFIGSCTTTDEESFTYFGGKIIHPKSEYVLLYNQNELIDSLLLDKEDKFVGKYKDFNEGFYIFRHGNEIQHVYIEQKDSILIRLNTWDFDETLVFSGKGADKNNILIDWFLESEKEDKKFSNYYRLSPDLFKSKMDSLLSLKKQKIELFKSKNENLPESYLNVLDIIVNYPLYTKFERYPRHHKYFNKTKAYPKTGADFYSYRKNININIDSLKYLGAYSKYVANRIYNNAYSIDNDDLAINLLNTIDKNITNEKLKNTFLYEMLINDFLDNSSCSLDKKAFYTYFKLSTDIEDKKQVQRIINDVKTIHGSDKLPDFEITDYLKTKRSIKKITKNNNSVIYFWNPKNISNSYLIRRINYLEKKFPKVKFVLVKIANIDTEHVNGLDIKNQYYIDADSKANVFLTSKLPRTFLVNKKGVITNGYASISSSAFNMQIKRLQKN